VKLALVRFTRGLVLVSYEARACQQRQVLREAYTNVVRDNNRQNSFEGSIYK